MDFCVNIHFTSKAEFAINNSMKAASELGHSYIGTEHMLLGLLSVKGSVAEKILGENGQTKSESADRGSTPLRRVQLLPLHGQEN